MHHLSYKNWLVSAALSAATAFSGCSTPEPLTPSGPNLAAANEAARHVHAGFEAHGKPLEALLAQLEKAVPPPDELTKTLAAARAELPENAVIVVYAAQQRFVASDALPQGPPMTRYLLPAVRQAMVAGQSVVTDLWFDGAKHPWVTMVRVRGTGDKQLAAATVIRADGPALQAMLAGVPKGATKEIRVLDGAGVAIWSTNPAQHFKSAVHGTYLVDQVRLGAPVQTRCHSCHEDASKKIVREDIIATAVPVAGSAWSVVVH